MDLKWLEPLAKAEPAIGRFVSLVDEWVFDDKCLTLGVGYNPDSRKVFCVMSPKVPTWPMDTQISAFKHEWLHLACGHVDRAPEECFSQEVQGLFQIWNVAIDAVVHEIGKIDLESFVRVGIQPVTFDKLELPIDRAEPTYERLKQNATVIEMSGTQACGREDVLRKHRLGGNERLKHAAQSAIAGSHANAGDKRGVGRVIPEIPPVPAWAVEIQKYFRAKRRRTPVRSWRRGPANRLPIEVGEVLPGRPRIPNDLSATIMMDASGSITQEQIGLAIAAVQSAGWRSVKVRVFSDWLGEPVDPMMAATEATKHGGGTMIKHCAEEIDGDRWVVWMTDGMSADGLPKERDGWLWVLSTDPSRVRVQTKPEQA